jgi:hypothetical protein
MCSACGEKSDAAKKCRNCLCVWYCDKKCQNKHWKAHKKECKAIKMILDGRGGKLNVGTEEDLGPLPDLPPREECPLCMHVLPLHPQLSAYSTCCGKTLCCGCDDRHKMKTGGQQTCAFCRTAAPESDEEILTQMHKRVEHKDSSALYMMAMKYKDGYRGLQVDDAKCIELLRESADLGYPEAHYQLGVLHRRGEMGLEQNQEEARKYFKEAAEGGYLLALINLALIEHENGDYVAAMRHLLMSASGGYRTSMECLFGCFEDGLLRHDDLAETMQAFYRARAEMKNECRDEYIAYLKSTGENTEEYEDFM